MNFSSGIANSKRYFRLDDVAITYDHFQTFNHMKADSSGYRFGFNGQEKDNELYGSGEAYCYSLRMMDPRLGKFFKVDPLIYKYPWLSSYAFSSNRVIDGVDIEGLEFMPVRSSMYLMKTAQQTTVDGKAIYYTYRVQVVSSNVPDAVKADDGTFKFAIWPVGTFGEDDKSSPVFTTGEARLVWDNGDGTPEPTSATKGNDFDPPSDNCPKLSDNKSGGADAASGALSEAQRGAKNIISTIQASAIVTEMDNRQFFYEATKIVDQAKYIPVEFSSGVGRADLINVLTDGTLPSYEYNLMSPAECLEKSTYELNLLKTANDLAVKNGIPIREEMVSKAKWISQVNKDAGGNGCATSQ